MEVKELETKVKVAVNLLKAISNERRLLILCTLYRGEKSVGQLEEIIGLSQSALSQHLARLRRDGVVATRREAQTIYYSLTCDASIAMMRALHDVFCTDAKRIHAEHEASKQASNGN
jgi:DNA-binding transcriptional ArsR family regulator